MINLFQSELEKPQTHIKSDLNNFILIKNLCRTNMHLSATKQQFTNHMYVVVVLKSQNAAEKTLKKTAREMIRSNRYGNLSLIDQLQ
jgi:predicted acetyltransferase